MSDEERAVWVDAMKAELASLDQLEVHESTKRTGMNTERLPARLILVKKPDRQEHDRRTAEARV
eukprot:9397590-Prorocentrum_lima.AAC.1